jgi:hypothetical protein
MTDTDAHDSEEPYYMRHANCWHNLLFSAFFQTEESKSVFSIRSRIQSEAFANSILYNCGSGYSRVSESFELRNERYISMEDQEEN